MKRVPEPELMQDLLQVKAYSEADFSISDDSLINSIGEYLLRKGRKLNSKSLIIDIGCGPGNITERLSAKWPSVEVLGIDGSESMIAVARNRKNKLKDKEAFKKISYSCLDISLIADGLVNLGKSANLIVSNSLLHHIHFPNMFWKALRALSGKDTLHYHRDLRRPSSLADAISLQKTYLPDSPKILISDYLASMQAAFTVAEVKIQLENEGLDQLTVHEDGDRYLEVVGNL